MNRVVFKNKIKKIALQKQPIFMLIWEVIWQARDFLSFLSRSINHHPLSLFLNLCSVFSTRSIFSLNEMMIEQFCKNHFEFNDVKDYPNKME